MLEAAIGLCVTLYSAIIQDPLRVLYMNGPTFLGFWHNLGPHEICARITSRLDAAFWLDNVKQCEQLIEREFQSFHVMVRSIVYFGAVVWAIRNFWNLALSGFFASIKQIRRAVRKKKPLEICDTLEIRDAAAPKIYQISNAQIFQVGPDKRFYIREF